MAIAESVKLSVNISTHVMAWSQHWSLMWELIWFSPRSFQHYWQRKSCIWGYVDNWIQNSYTSIRSLFVALWTISWKLVIGHCQCSCWMWSGLRSFAQDTMSYHELMLMVYLQLTSLNILRTWMPRMCFLHHMIKLQMVTLFKWPQGCEYLLKSKT